MGLSHICISGEDLTLQVSYRTNQRRRIALFKILLITLLYRIHKKRYPENYKKLNKNSEMG
jgi:hypothetical protein